MRELIVVVDTQADFLLPDGALPVPGAADLVAPLHRWLRERTVRDTAAVLFTFDTHDAATYPTSAEAKLFPIHCVKGTPGWRNLIDPAAVAADIPAHALEKGVFDMWAEDDAVVRDLRHPAAPPVAREAFIAGLLAAGVTRAVVVGVAADYCVRQAITGLVAHGFEVAVPVDLTRGIARSIEQVAAEDFAAGTLALLRNS